MIKQPTFVTAFFKIYDDPPLKIRTLDWRMVHFEQLAKTGIQLVIYTCDEYINLLEPFLTKYSNLRIGKIMKFSETQTWKMIESAELERTIELPEKRSVTKDTKEYISLMNAKTEFIHYAIEDNPWNSDYFAWIDFNIFHIFKENDSKYADQIIRTMSLREYQQDDFLVVPGCWDYNWTNEWSIPNEVCWRFCGGFFFGTTKCLLDFHATYLDKFPEFLRKFGVLSWEVNVWSWMELCGYFRPIWYNADHNSRILEFTADICSRSLKYMKSVRYAYPHLGDGFVPTTTSYFYDSIGAREIINTRFVNYIILPNGCYHINNENGYLYTRNMISFLENGCDSPLNFTEVKEDDENGLVNYGGNIYGLEDIRMYRLSGENTVRFIASNRNHIPNFKIRIISGIYDVDGNMCRNLRILHPPTDTYCEKNWIPLSMGTNALISPLHDHESWHELGHEYFIYRWMPFEIGCLDKTNQLRIVTQYKHFTPYWRNVRGSSCLEETEEGYLCVVHFSEEKHPRHYFHMLVLLEKGTYKPLKYSRFFYFHNKSIEFCTGFCKKGDIYCFWISNFDRDPEYLEVLCEEIDLCYDITVI